MKRFQSKMATLAAVTVMAGCATSPMGPTAVVLPARDKPFDVFVRDQTSCKQFASQQVAGQAEAANQQAAGGVLLTTLLGTALGGAIGNSQGAGVGAASGAAAGAAGGTAASQGAQGAIQLQYDNAYTQCMYAKGHQIPGVDTPQAAMQGGQVGDPTGSSPPASSWIAPPPPVK
jgi:uncharacterized protein YcfJ